MDYSSDWDELARRLADAERDGDRVLGVIRGIGLSNDGRGAGLLAPSAEGQAVAMRRAYALAGLKPTDVSLLECAFRLRDQGPNLPAHVEDVLHHLGKM